jgi:hypothetical protein
MKKSMNSTILLLALGTLTLIGCKKEAEPVMAEYGKAEISGIAWAELDNTVAGYEKVPAGTKIMAWINTADLITNANLSSGTYETKYYDGVVGANGSYKFTIDVNQKPVNVNIIPADFAFDQVISSTETQRSIYKAGSFSISVTKGGNKIQDINYFN